LARSRTGSRGASGAGGLPGGKTLTANQIQFLEQIVENLSRTGVVDPARLYEPPDTRLNAMGVAGVFPDSDVVDRLIAVLEDVRQRAMV